MVQTRFVTAAVASLMIAGPWIASSQAADVYAGPVAPVVSPAPLHYSWAGWYAGAHAGYGSADIGGVYDSSQTPPGIPTEFSTLGNLDGFLGGAHLGYNFQYGSFVLGVEGDFTGSDLSGEASTIEVAPDYLRADVDYMTSIRGRVGFTYGSALIYGTAGAMFAEYTIEAQDFSPPAGVGRITFEDTGFVYGGGIDVALNEQLSIGVEYLHADIDINEALAQGTMVNNPDVDSGDFFTADGIDIVRARINVKICSFTGAC